MKIMNVQNIINAMETIAPLRFAADWDNVGLLIGSRGWSAQSVMLTIDLTEPVLEEAVSAGAQMVIAYHPPIFSAIKSLTDETGGSVVALKAARAGVAVFSPHTALDAAPGGVNDWLAQGLMTSNSRGDVRALKVMSDLPESEQCKIITFAPAESVEHIRNGLAAVGAGRIGEYQLCSFEIAGKGTFLGGDDANPSVGRRGQLEHFDEIQLQMVCPKAALGLAVMAIKQFHPYEEPPIEIYQLMARPRRSTGQGRRVVFDQPVAMRSLIQRLKSHLRVQQVHVAKALKPPSRVSIAGLCAGAGGSLCDTAISQGCNVFITGEMRHHDVLAAQARGCTVVLAGHTNTERGYLGPLREQLAKMLPDVEFQVSRRDRDPLRVM
jgi:dinuclear metal center YbgI/SA1388 family protein